MKDQPKVCRPHILLNLLVDYPWHDFASLQARLLSALQALGGVTYGEATFGLEIPEIDNFIKKLAAHGHDIEYVKGRYVLKTKSVQEAQP